MGQTRRDVPSLFEATHTVQLSRNLVKHPSSKTQSTSSSISSVRCQWPYSGWRMLILITPVLLLVILSRFVLNAGNMFTHTGKPIHFALPFLPQPPMTFSPSVWPCQFVPRPYDFGSVSVSLTASLPFALVSHLRRSFVCTAGNGSATNKHGTNSAQCHPKIVGSIVHAKLK